MGLVHRGEGFFVDTDPVEGAKDIYPYVEFQSAERASVGLVQIEGNPEKGAIGETEEVNEEGFSEPVGMVMEAGMAIDDADKRYVFEENPAVEFTKKAEFTEFAEAAGSRIRAEWDGPGVYDGRDGTKMYESADEAELADMEVWADEVIEGMFQGDEWEEARDKLLVA